MSVGRTGAEWGGRGVERLICRPESNRERRDADDTRAVGTLCHSFGSAATVRRGPSEDTLRRGEERRGV